MDTSKLTVTVQSSSEENKDMVHELVSPESRRRREVLKKKQASSHLLSLTKLKSDSGTESEEEKVNNEFSK
tara:strand:- start:615 stop:827 length:213 start_codon:yes stop_codon:yes gene_type:complete